MSKMLALLATALFIGSSSACVYLMGEAKDSVQPHPAGTEWNYGLRGDDWNGVDGNNVSWVCSTGKTQSPINLVQYSKNKPSPKYLQTSWSYTPLKSNGSNIKVFNNGHTIQIQWDANALKSKVQFASTGKGILDVLEQPPAKDVKKFELEPLQFHFHTVSEHAVDGMYYALELHIVHVIPQSALPGCPSGGCLSVTAIMLKVADDIETDNKWLKAIWDVMPEREGVVDYMKAGTTLDLEKLMPSKNNRGYMQYSGSLTTPPCTEGLLWHVLKTPISISQAQYNKFARSVGLKECSEVKEDKEEDKEEKKTRRSAMEHSDDAHERLASFQRGAYSGFVRAEELAQTVSPIGNRKLMTAHKDSATNYTCKVVAFGYNNRNLQPLNEPRTVLSF